MWKKAAALKANITHEYRCPGCKEVARPKKRAQVDKAATAAADEGISAANNSEGIAAADREMATTDDGISVANREGIATHGTADAAGASATDAGYVGGLPSDHSVRLVLTPRTALLQTILRLTTLNLICSKKWSLPIILPRLQLVTTSLNF